MAGMYAGSLRRIPRRPTATAACPASGMSMTTTRGAAAARPGVFSVTIARRLPLVPRGHDPNCACASLNASSAFTSPASSSTALSGR
jgi:hypothetical protein